MFGRKRRAAIKAEIGGLQAGLKWGRTFGIKVLADSPERAVNLVNLYMRQLSECESRSWRGRLTGVEWVGADLPELLTEAGKIVHHVRLRFEDDPQDKWTGV